MNPKLIQDCYISDFVYKRFLLPMKYNDSYCLFHWKLKYYLEETGNYNKAKKNKIKNTYYLNIDKGLYLLVKSKKYKSVKYFQLGNPNYNFWKKIKPKYEDINQIYELE